MTSRTLVQCWVPGIAKTKGSMRPVGGRLVESVDNTAWRRQVGQRVREASGCDPDNPYAGPVAVTLVFFLRKPTGPAPGDEEGATWYGAGDVDKLARLVLDAIECSHPEDAHLISNDNNVASLMVQKHIADADVPPGAVISVATVDPKALRQQALWATPHVRPTPPRSPFA